MKKITFLFCLLISFSGYSTNWLNSLEQAQKLALASNRLIVLDFTADWCGPCKKMEREVWYDQEVQTAMNNFVPLRLDYDSELSARSKYSVKGIPDIFIINGNGDIVYHHLGYMDKGTTIEMLKKYSLQTSFLQTESINYYKHPSYVTSLRLAKKYLDYSLGLDDEVKRNFLELAENYLGESEKQMEESQANFKMITEQIQLLELVSDMYKERYNRVFRILGRDFDESTVSEINKPLFYFLYAGCSKFDDHKDKAKWLDKLNSADGNAIYLKKLELMMDLH